RVRAVLADRPHGARQNHSRPALAEPGEERDHHVERQRERALLDRDERRLHEEVDDDPRDGTDQRAVGPDSITSQRESSWSIAKLPRPFMRMSTLTTAPTPPAAAAA